MPNRDPPGPVLVSESVSSGRFRKCTPNPPLFLEFAVPAFRQLPAAPASHRARTLRQENAVPSAHRSSVTTALYVTAIAILLALLGWV